MSARAGQKTSRAGQKTSSVQPAAAVCRGMASSSTQVIESVGGIPLLIEFAMVAGRWSSIIGHVSWDGGTDEVSGGVRTVDAGRRNRASEEEHGGGQWGAGAAARESKGQPPCRFWFSRDGDLEK